MADVRQTMAALGLGLVFVPLTSCSLKVKVREDWSALHREPIALGEAARTWSDLKQGKTPTDAGIEAYNRAVLGSVSQAAPKWAAGGQGGIRIRTGGGELPLTVDSTRIPGIALSEQVLPADHVQVRRGLRHQSVVEGIGIPLVVKKPRSDSDPMIPESGLWVPATALLDLDRPGKPVLEVLDPTSVSRLEFGAAGFPLAANYTAAFARDFRDRQFQFQSALALLRFEDYADRIGLYRVTPFHPDKEPCIFIHGINSSPSTWDEVMNRIYGDESIRERHEFWTFGYPTGAPIPYMAAELRESIRGMLAFRAANGARDQRITLVGHSMGGLHAKMMVVDSGTAIWDAIATVPFDQLRLPPKARAAVRTLAFFEPLPFVKRVVFIATPHRGSVLASLGIGRLASLAVREPADIAAIREQAVALNPGALRPEYATGVPTTIDLLRPSSPTLQAIDRLRPACWVGVHSIVGDVHPSLTGGRDDCVVAVESAHTPYAISEIMVPAKHTKVHHHPLAVAEVRRILQQHLHELGR